MCIRDRDAEAFDRLLAATPPGGEIDYALAQPKWVFLRYLLDRGYLLHGSNEPGIDEFRTRPQRDAHGNPIAAHDFPFRPRTMRHGKEATPNTVAWRAALRRHR